MPTKFDLSGKTFGRLTVIGFLDRDAKLGARWLCRCECGGSKQVPGRDLRSGNIKSCGCLHRDQLRERNTTHGGKGTRAYVIWQSMKQRCSNPRHRHFKDYGGRGIVVCERWRDSFENFLADMGEPPAEMTLDRYPDTNGNYEPGNCRWANDFQQARNSRKALRLTYQGITKPLRDWAEELGINIRTLTHRVKAGWSPEKVIETPISYTKIRRTT